MPPLDRLNTLAQTSALLTSSSRVFAPIFEEDRFCVSLDHVGEAVLRAVIATEDKRFFSHRGVDIRGIFRAAYVNLRTLRIAQGGSTITQQLARMAILRRSDRTLIRKVLETVLAISMEWRLTKRQILEAYLNAAYFGHNLYGIEMAARALCGQSAAHLSDADAAYLVSLLRAPARYCRCCNPHRANDRAALVMRLARMPQCIEQPKPARKLERRQTCADNLSSTAPYVIQYARAYLKRNLSSYYPKERLKVHTTIDERCQLVLELVCAMVRRFGYSGRLCCVVQDSHSGAVKAFVGGSDWKRQQFNVATDGVLQPGSLLKPFILLAALENGISLEHRYESRPLTIPLPGGREWTVRNAGNRYTGWTTIADALVHSDNSVYAQLLADIGTESVGRILMRVGIPARHVTLSVSTGAIRPGVSPLQVCAAYSVFSTGGLFFPASMISRVVNEQGGTVWQTQQSSIRVCASSAASAVRSVLKRVNAEGTGVLPLPHDDLAAKTGTTVSGGWYLGFDDLYRVLTWTESDFTPFAHTYYSDKAVSAKHLASRIWYLLKKKASGFQELFSVFAGVDSMSVSDLLWMEEQFQCP